MFSGLTRCGACGGGYILSSRDTMVCFNARERGTCSNRRTIKRQEVEGRALRAMRERFFEPGAFTAFCEGFTAEMNNLRREHIAQMAGARRELAVVEREIKQLVQAIKDGVAALAIKEELSTLEARKAALKTALTDPPVPAMHPRMAQVFQEKVSALCRGLENATGL